MQIDTSDLLERFLSYVRIDTRADADCPECPSSPVQWDLLRKLAGELRDLGLADVVLTDKGYVLATLPSNTSKNVPTLAWCGHADTATNLPSAAKPLVHRNYDGRTITLPDDPSKTLSPDTSKHLGACLGHDIITASGKSLLGADDKAGVAIVVAAIRHLLKHPEIKHGAIRVCFNPDEEIGRGMTALDLSQLKADFAYTLDGDIPGEINYETFSADGAVIDIQGIASHPGAAKDVMVNALRIAGRILAALPPDKAPENTADRQGFIHPHTVTGTSEQASIRFILRDFELDGLAAHGALLRSIVAEEQRREPRAKIELTIKEQYRNMRYWLEKDMRPVNFAKEAYARAGLDPHFSSIRGGTDGSNLTARGLPCPNLFTGMQEIHSEREWVSLQDMNKAVETLIHLAQVWEEKS